MSIFGLVQTEEFLLFIKKYVRTLKHSNQLQLQVKSILYRIYFLAMQCKNVTSYQDNQRIRQTTTFKITVGLGKYFPSQLNFQSKAYNAPCNMKTSYNKAIKVCGSAYWDENQPPLFKDSKNMKKIDKGIWTKIFLQSISNGWSKQTWLQGLNFEVKT